MSAAVDASGAGGGTHISEKAGADAVLRTPEPLRVPPEEGFQRPSEGRVIAGGGGRGAASRAAEPDGAGGGSAARDDLSEGTSGSDGSVESRSAHVRSYSSASHHHTPSDAAAVAAAAAMAASPRHADGSGLTVDTCVTPGPSPLTSAVVNGVEYGFYSGTSRYEKSGRVARTLAQTLARRVVKWEKMLDRWPRYGPLDAPRHAKLKSRVRKGIPDRMRARAWKALTGSGKLADANRGLYAALCEVPQPEYEAAIRRDLNRTFPLHEKFAERGGAGQMALLRLLTAYAGAHPEVGYCQGMAFIVAVLLTYYEEEDAYWMLVRLMDPAGPYDMAGLFRPGLPRFQLHLYQFAELLKATYPRLAAHLTEEGADASMYASQWFVTLFSYSFPFELVMRVWDCMLLERWKIVFRVAIALLAMNRRKLMRMDFEEIIPLLKSLPESIVPDTVMREALHVRIATRQLAALAEEFSRQSVREEAEASRAEHFARSGGFGSPAKK